MVTTHYFMKQCWVVAVAILLHIQSVIPFGIIIAFTETTSPPKHGRIVKLRSLFDLRCHTVLFAVDDDVVRRPCSIVTANNLAFHHDFKRVKTTHLTLSNDNDFATTDILDNIIPKLDSDMLAYEFFANDYFYGNMIGVSATFAKARKETFGNQTVRELMESIQSVDELITKVDKPGISTSRVKPFWLAAKESEQIFFTDNLTEAYFMTINSNKIELQDFIKAIQFEIEKAENDNNYDKKSYGRLCELKGKANNTFTILADKEDIYSKFEMRIADIEHEISSDKTKMTYKFDRDCFSKKVDFVFEEWYKNEKKDFMAPYFPLVQSSGMGKTKLLYEYKQKMNNDVNSKIQCIMLSCEVSKDSWSKRNNRSKEVATIFDDAFIIPYKSETSEMEQINNILDKLLEKSKSEATKVVICFDEAQLLLSEDAFPFRCIRWWLRLRMPDRKQVVAVFTGTTSKLANFYQETQTTGSSRNPDISMYYDKGTKLYSPFYQLCTTGVLARKLSGTTNNPNANDFDIAIKYGRPLFATLDWSEKKENRERIIAICTRMLLLNNNDKEWSLDSHFSILGTRVQFGQTHFNLASKLVSNGYAVLSSFDPDSPVEVARICYQTDPVCAYVAMALMTKGFNFDDKNQWAHLKGKDPMYWTTKANELVTRGICRPAKGDIGEVAGALYLLFCGDYLRYKQNKELTTFSVSLLSWIDMLFRPKNLAGSEPDESVDCNTTFQVSLIQVCTNFLRHPSIFLLNKQLLQRWYEAGLAYYSCSQREAYDILVPIRYMTNTQNQGHQYCPLLVQIKNCAEFRYLDREVAFEKMHKVFKNAKIERGVGIVLLLGHECPNNIKQEMSEDQYKLDTLKNVTEWCKNGKENKILMCCIAVPDHDCYGINNLARSSIFGGPTAEIYESSPIVREIAESFNVLPNKTELSMYLRSASTRNDTSYFTNIFNAFQDDKE